MASNKLKVGLFQASMRRGRVSDVAAMRHLQHDRDVSSLYAARAGFGHQEFVATGHGGGA